MNEDPKWDAWEFSEAERDDLLDLFLKVFDLVRFTYFMKSSLLRVLVIIFLF